MSYEASIHTQTSILPEGANASLIFQARGLDESEIPVLRVKADNGDYTTSQVTVHLEEITVGRINDTVRSLRRAADDIAAWNTIRDDALDSVATSDGPT